MTEVKKLDRFKSSKGPQEKSKFDPYYHDRPYLSAEYVAVLKQKLIDLGLLVPKGIKKAVRIGKNKEEQVSES